MNLRRFVAIGALFSATPALAISPGNIVSCSGSPDLACSLPSNVVQDGPEMELVGGAFDFVLHLDFSQDLLTVTETSSAGLIVVLPEADATPSFTNTPETFLFATLIGNNVTGFEQSDISLIGGVLTLDLRETAWTSQSTFQISFAEQVTEPSVPEPASWAMTLLGLGVAGLMLRKRNPRRMRSIRSARRARTTL